MNELSDLAKGLNRSLVKAQLDHTGDHRGDRHLKSFLDEVDAIAERYAEKYNGLHSVTGADTSAAMAAMLALVAKVKSNAIAAGAVEPPGAA